MAKSTKAPAPPLHVPIPREEWEGGIAMLAENLPQWLEMARLFGVEIPSELAARLPNLASVLGSTRRELTLAIDGACVLRVSIGEQ